MLQYHRGRRGAPSTETTPMTRSLRGAGRGAPDNPENAGDEDASAGEYAGSEEEEEEEQDEEDEEEEKADVHHARKRAKSRTESVASYGRRSSVGSPTSSTSDSVTPRRRRPTYLLQKDEREQLAEQVRLMEAQLELLRIKAGVSTLADSKSIASLAQEKLSVEEDIQRNLLQLARLQSLVTRQLHAIPLFPLSSRISLPADPEERRAIMESVRDLKLRRAAEIVLDRLSTMDPSKPYRHEERRTSPDGLHHWFCFEVQQFEGLRSVKQFFDVMLYMQNNLEISVSEMLGQITLREDTEEDDPTLFNQRIVTTGEVGGTEELNLVGFARWYDSYMPHNGAEFGVIAIDSVKDDALYPYKPLERTCKDVQIAHTISEHRKPGTDELVVVLASATFMTQLPPQFPLPAIVWDKLIENMPRWAIATKQFLRDAVAALAAANADD